VILKRIVSAYLAFIRPSRMDCNLIINGHWGGADIKEAGSRVVVDELGAISAGDVVSIGDDRYYITDVVIEVAPYQNRS
jgi:hypothetical protein